MNKIDWEEHRRPDGSINLLSAYQAVYGPIPQHKLKGAQHQVDRIEGLQPIKSRQTAAVALELMSLSSVTVVQK